MEIKAAFAEIVFKIAEFQQEVRSHDSEIDKLTSDLKTALNLLAKAEDNLEFKFD